MKIPGNGSMEVGTVIRKIDRVPALVLVFLLASGAAASAQAAQAAGAPQAEGALDVLKKADAALIPKNASFRWSLKVEREGEPVQENRFLGFKKGDLKYLFYDYYPDSAYGQSHLRIDAAIWMYLPLADDTVKTSYKSAFLNSGLSYADVMYNELARYYDASVLSPSAKAAGLDGDRDCYELELKAKKGADGYARIVSYIDRESFLTVRREYFSLSGQRLKEISFGGFELAGGVVRAFRLEISNDLDPAQKTTARFWDLKAEDKLSEKYFSLNFARTWQPKVEADKP
jgi:outer membrane lipoprotein-sorting protein